MAAVVKLVYVGPQGPRPAPRTAQAPEPEIDTQWIDRLHSRWGDPPPKSDIRELAPAKKPGLAWISGLGDRWAPASRRLTA
jgi:hypothetical protein